LGCLSLSFDPEGGKISYGWDWDSDYVVDEWTDPVDSGTKVNISHSWTEECTYNIRVRAKDERSLSSGWSKHIVVIMCSDNIPDQQQTIIDKGVIFGDCWGAQSFVPSLNKLSKVELALTSCGLGDPPPLNFYIRDHLSGNNLAESSLLIPPMKDMGRFAWFSFDFEDLDVIPGNTYYIVIKETGPAIWHYSWKWKEGDPYPLGKTYWSKDGNEWHSENADVCFVTWGKM
jgi:hypothetical protein